MNTGSLSFKFILPFLLLQKTVGTPGYELVFILFSFFCLLCFFSFVFLLIVKKCSDDTIFLFLNENVIVTWLFKSAPRSMRNWMIASLSWLAAMCNAARPEQSKDWDQIFDRDWIDFAELFLRPRSRL